MAFIDCNEQISASKKTWPERPHCEHGFWISSGRVWWSPTRSTWNQILQRTKYWKARNQRECYRGIGVAWDSFDEFLEDMGPRPSREHSIDRIDSEGDYTKDNCRWLLTSINKSRGARNRARQQSEAMIERMESELEDLETELQKEGIEINE